jgi:hypothetical protein
MRSAEETAREQPIQQRFRFDNPAGERWAA